MTQEISLSTILIERAAAIMQLKAHQLPLDWVKEFPVGQLAACCGRMDAVLPDEAVLERQVQRELIQNPSFAAWYAKLLPMLPEEPPAEEEEPKPARAPGQYRAAPPAPPLSRRAALTVELCKLLEACTVNATDIAAYPPDRVAESEELQGLCPGRCGMPSAPGRARRTSGC